MAVKIKYSVIKVSGEEHGYSAKNLENHHPTMLGWQSERFCEFPQEIVFHLCESCHLKKIQILSHQYLITSKVEIFVAQTSSPEDFKRLGYVHLSNNETNDFKSRELKSVHIDAEGQYLKLLLHKNHENKFNPFNQVGIIALNVLAVPISDVKKKISSMKQQQSPLNGVNRSYSATYDEPCIDDMLYDMYMDPQVISVLRRLGEKKKLAVSEEQFDEAKKIKLAVDDLQKIGDRLARLELDKQQAVLKEDYDLAKSKKIEMEEVRLRFYEQLRKHNLNEEIAIFTAKSGMTSYQNISDHTMASDFQSRSSLRESLLNYSRIDPSFPSSRHSMTSNSVAPSHVSFCLPTKDSRSKRPVNVISYDEKVIPTLDKHRKPDPFLTEESSSPVDGAQESFTRPTEPEPLSEVCIREAKSVIETFGLSLATNAYSKVWHFRASALSNAHHIISDVPDGLSRAELRKYVHAVALLLAKMIKDHVFAVHQAALRLLDTVLVDFIPRHELGKVEITQVIAQSLPALIQKTGETTPRGRNSAFQFILHMIKFMPVHSLSFVPSYLLSPIAKETAHRLALSRVELVNGILKERGLSDDLVDLDSLMKFSLSALEHPSGPVRDETIKLLYAIYRQVGPEVRDYFPPKHNLIWKTPLYRHLFDGFDQIDRKHPKFDERNSTPMQSKVVKNNQRQPYKKEVETLQSQINNLNSMIEDYQGVRRVTNASDTRKRTSVSDKYQVYKPGKIHINPHPKPSANIRSFSDDSIDSSMESDDFYEQTCIFCGEQDESFTEDGLDFHYWRHCPMLKRCAHCKQVVEICNFSEHLLTECDGKNNFKFCPRCSEAVLKINFDSHVASKNCPVLIPNSEEHCPLCHKNIPFGEESWQRHLMGSQKDACRENPRRIAAIKRLTSKSNQQENLQFPISL